MAALQKITTTYSESEDRLCLAGQNAAGDTTTLLWLTQRMANRLVQTLTEWLETEVDGKLAAMPSDLRQAWVQETAMRQLEPTTPVRVAQGAMTLLVLAVDLTRDGQRYRIVFRCPDGEAENDPSLSLSSTELRQWLAILRSLYQAAGWPLASWPSWMEQPQHQAQQGVVLH